MYVYSLHFLDYCQDYSKSWGQYKQKYFEQGLFYTTVNDIHSNGEWDSYGTSRYGKIFVQRLSGDY